MKFWPAIALILFAYFEWRVADWLLTTFPVQAVFIFGTIGGAFVLILSFMIFSWWLSGVVEKQDAKK